MAFDIMEENFDRCGSYRRLMAMYNISEQVAHKKPHIPEMSDLLYPVAVFEDSVWICEFAIDSRNSRF